MKFNLYKPYFYYNSTCTFAKYRELEEFEAILLSLICYSPKSKMIFSNENNSDSIMSDMNLEPKWNDLINERINSMNGNEINFDKAINHFELMVGDIEVNHFVKEKLDNDSFLGVEKHDWTKTKEYLIDIYNSSHISDFNSKCKNIENIKNEKLLKIEDEYNKHCEVWLEDKFNDEFNKSNDKVIKKIKIGECNNRLRFYPIQFDFDIDIKEKTIRNNDKDFLDIIKKSEDNDYCNLIMSLFQDEINNKIDFDNEEKLPEVIYDYYAYNDILNQVQRNNKDTIDFKDFLLFEGKIVKLGKYKQEMKINHSMNNIKIWVLSYRLLTENETELFFNKNKENENWNFVKLLERIVDTLQKELIKSNMLENFEELFNIDRYKNWLIENVNNIPNIRKMWLLNDDVRFDDFQKILSKIGVNKFKDILDKSKNMSISETKLSIDKINFLYKEHKISIKDIDNNFNEFKEFNNYNDSFEKVLASNDISTIVEFAQSLPKFKIEELSKEILLIEKRCEEEVDNLIKQKKDLLINKINEIFQDKIKGNIDTFYKKNYEQDVKNDKKFIPKKNTVFDNNELKMVGWLKKERHEWAHSDNDNYIKRLENKNLEQLNEYCEKLLKAVNVMKRGI